MEFSASVTESVLCRTQFSLVKYYGMEFSAPVIEHMRFNTALIDTALIVVVTPIAFYMALNTIRMVVSDDAEDESQENPDEE